jgi:hypothetical protein
MSPVTMAVTAGVIAAGAGMVALGLRATHGTLAGALEEGLARVE